MRALLDINVLIALFDADHVHHAIASNWLEQNGESGWASCPVTQNGCVRIMSQPRYPNALALQDIVSRLGVATTSPYHQFLPDSISLLDKQLIDQRRLHSPRQLTDIYLLALAVEHDCHFVTFDQAIPLAAARNANRHSLVVI